MQPGTPTVSDLQCCLRFDTDPRYSHVDPLVNGEGLGEVAGLVAGEEKTEELSRSKLNSSFGSILVPSR